MPRKKNQIRLYAVIGEQHTGKGSTIRHLTGLAKANTLKPCYLSTANVQIKIDLYAEISSLQEGVLKRQYDPRKFVQKIKRLKYQPTDILVPLRFNRHNNLQDWFGYIDYFESIANWRIEGLIFLNDAKTVPPQAAARWMNVSNAYAPLSKITVATYPSNVLASRVRSAWRWI